jgi:predicted GIY-YIG superfamily endonuclease
VTYVLLGSAYLLHFDKPYQHASHYLGWSSNLPVRLAAHESGRGARLTEVVAEAGIRWVLTRTWPGVSRDFERALKNQGGASRRCPGCGVVPKPHPPSAHWDAVLRGGFAVSLTAKCTRCRRRKTVMDFDLTGQTRRVCLECLDVPTTAPRSRRVLIGATA